MADNDYKNKTGTDLDILKTLEKSFIENNGPKAKRNIKKSMDWFRKRIAKNYKTVRTARMYRDRDLWKNGMTLGKMYFFEYDAKLKDELPVWDRYPLIIPFDAWKGKDPDGEKTVEYVLGLNFHYLPPALRMAAFRALLRFKNRDRFVKSTKLDFSWKVIMALAQSKYFKHSVKMYRMDHVRSKFVEIPSQSWEMVLFLPLARWQKGSKSQAWRV
ncbi:MAG: hypothetical protein R3230_00990 [Nitrosopumilaceae archaeon]|nr:hypothetical protein [Nitrosopumilaceae archaeon]